MNGRMKALSAVLAIVALIGLVGSGMTVKDVLGAKDYYEQKDIESTENLNKLDDGLKTLQENEQAYLDGKKAYADGQEQLAEGEKTLADGYAEYEKGKKDYADGEAKLAAGKKKLDDNKAAYEQGKKDYAAGVKQLAAGKETLDNGKKSLQTLKELMNNIAQLNQSYTSAWRRGFEAVDAAGYVTDGNLDKKKAKTDKAQLESAIEAYEGVTGLEKNGASFEQAIAMVAASQGQKPEDIAKLYSNYDSIMTAGKTVDTIIAIDSQEAAENFVFNTEAGAAAKDAYNGIKQAMAAYGLDLDNAAAAVVKAGAAAEIQGNSEVMANIQAYAKQAADAKVDAGEFEAGSDEYNAFIEQTVKATVEQKANEYVSSSEGQEKIGQAKYAYNTVSTTAATLQAIDNVDDAAAFIDKSQGLDEGTTKTAYGYYSSGAAEAVKSNVDRLQKPTADDGIKHEEAVAAVASVAGVSAETVETAYKTVNAMGGTDKAKANVNSLDALSKDGGQIDQLNNGRKTLQGYLGQILDGIAGNDAFKAYVSADEVKTLRSLIGGTDKQFEAGADAFFNKAKQLSGLVSSVEKQIQEGQISYDEGVAALNAGKAKLKEYEDGLATYNQGVKDLAAGAAKLADAEKQLADGEKALADGKKELAEGAAKLAEYEDGVAQVKDGLQQVVDTEADPGIESIAERLGAGFTYEDANGDLNIAQGFTALDSAWAYKADDGDAITSEMYTRIGGAVSAVIASLMALVAAFLAFKKKYKGALPCAGISAAAAVVASVLAQKAGMYFSNLAGSSMGSMALYAGIVLAAVAAVHAIADGSAAKAEK